MPAAAQASCRRAVGSFEIGRGMWRRALSALQELDDGCFLNLSAIRVLDRDQIGQRELLPLKPCAHIFGRLGNGRLVVPSKHAAHGRHNAVWRRPRQKILDHLCHAETMPRLTGPFHGRQDGGPHDRRRRKGGWNWREPSPERATAFTQSRRAIPSPPCGGGPTRAKPERGGGPPGIGLPVETGPPCISRRGKASECVNPSPERERGRGEGPGRRTEGSGGSAATAAPSPGRAFRRDSTSPVRERW